MEKHIVQVNIYSESDGVIQYLLLKRVIKDGGFWQPVTGTVDDGESLTAAIYRELAEETGISDVISLSLELHSYTWQWRGNQEGTDHVFAAHIASSQPIKLNPYEHDNYEWLDFDAALNRLKWPGNRESLAIVHKHVLEGASGAINVKK